MLVREMPLRHLSLFLHHKEVKVWYVNTKQINFVKLIVFRAAIAVTP